MNTELESRINSKEFNISEEEWGKLLKLINGDTPIPSGHEINAANFKAIASMLLTAINEKKQPKELIKEGMEEIKTILITLLRALAKSKKSK